MDADYLNSYLRFYLLSSLDKREVSISQLKGNNVWSQDAEENFVLTDMNNTLNAWQSEEALNHWKSKSALIVCWRQLIGAVMREILPDIVWETY